MERLNVEAWLSSKLRLDSADFGGTQTARLTVRSNEESQRPASRKAALTNNDSIRALIVWLPAVCVLGDQSLADAFRTIAQQLLELRDRLLRVLRGFLAFGRGCANEMAF